MINWERIWHGWMKPMDQSIEDTMSIEDTIGYQSEAFLGLVADSIHELPPKLYCLLISECFSQYEVADLIVSSGSPEQIKRVWLKLRLYNQDQFLVGGND